MIYGFQQVPKLRRLRQAGAVVCLLLVLVVTACSYSGPVHFYTLPLLHIPHLQWLPALSRIPQAGGTRGGIISGLTTFQRPGSSTAQVMLNLNNGLQVIGIDGTGHHLLNMGEDCYGPGAVTNDGRWIACMSFPDGDNGASRLQLVALHPMGTSQVRQVQLGAAPFYHYPTWSPDGQYLAVVLADVGGSCSVAVFLSPPPHATFTKAVNLISSIFDDQGRYCLISDIQWSEDGQHILVAGGGQATFIATTAIATLLQAFASSSPRHVINLEVTSDQIEAFTFANVYFDESQPSLDPQADTLLYTAGAPDEQLISFNLRTHQSATLFTLPAEYQINALAWLPDGRQVLIAVGGYPCVDCGRYAISDVYLYSPVA